MAIVSHNARLNGCHRVAHPMLNEDIGGSSAMKFLKKILLIDHEPHVTKIVKHALEQTGKYTIRTERDGSFALHAARWFEPDLILLDVAQEGPDADLLARQFQESAHLKDTPVLSLSNVVAGPQLMSGGILSGYSFFAAPIVLDEVLRGVESLLFGEKPVAKKRAA